MNRSKKSGRPWTNPSHVAGEAAERMSESLQRGDRLRRKVAAGWALGTFLIELPNSASLAAISLAGFDFVVLDLEHSGIGMTALENLITAGHAAGLTVLVRTVGEDPGLIGRVLDMGAHGIMAPHVDTAERARAIVEQARFRPLGSRGFSPLTRFDALAEPLEALGRSTYVVVQIEGKDALTQAAQIAAVKGIDAIFVGPYDLALSLGVAPGSEEVSEAAGRLAKLVPAQLGLGIYVDDPAKCGEWAKRRFALQCVSFDGRMLADAARLVANAASEAVRVETAGS